MNREQDIIKWGVDRRILGPDGQSTYEKQFKKTEEELEELREAIQNRDKDSIKDAIGDIVVTLVMQANMWNLSMDDCIEQAWNQIKDRKGKMVNGMFVKE